MAKSRWSAHFLLAIYRHLYNLLSPEITRCAHTAMTKRQTKAHAHIRRHASAHTDTGTHTHTSAHYVKYQMVKQTLWSHAGEPGCLSSHAFSSFWVSGPHTPALSSLHPGSRRSIRIFHPELGWNRAN